MNAVELYACPIEDANAQKEDVSKAEDANRV